MHLEGKVNGLENCIIMSNMIVLRKVVIILMRKMIQGKNRIQMKYEG